MCIRDRNRIQWVKGENAMHLNDDKYLALKAHSSIMDDPGLRPYGIKVSSNKGVVRLQGIVDVLSLIHILLRLIPKAYSGIY